MTFNNYILSSLQKSSVEGTLILLLRLTLFVEKHEHVLVCPRPLGHNKLRLKNMNNN